MTEVSDDYKVDFYAQETDSVFIVLLTFSSDELTEDIRIASDPKETLPDAGILGVVSNSLEYLYAPFDIRLPRDDKTGLITAKITIDNTDRTIIDNLRTITRPVTLQIDIVLSADVDYVEKTYQGFELSNVQYDSFSITADLTLDYWDNEPFPSGRYTPSGFPGLF